MLANSRTYIPKVLQQDWRKTQGDSGFLIRNFCSHSRGEPAGICDYICTLNLIHLLWLNFMWPSIKELRLNSQCLLRPHIFFSFQTPGLSKWIFLWFAIVTWKSSLKRGMCRIYHATYTYKSLNTITLESESGFSREVEDSVITKGLEKMKQSQKLNICLLLIRPHNPMKFWAIIYHLSIYLSII